MTRTEELKKLMADHHKSAADVADLLGRSPMTVRIWRCVNGDRAIPRDALELLKLKLEQQARQQ